LSNQYTYCIIAWQTTYEMSKLHNELNGKISEINRLQIELSRREDEETGDMDSFKRLIETLEKENTTLKVSKFMHYFFFPMIKKNELSYHSILYNAL